MADNYAPAVSYDIILQNLRRIHCPQKDHILYEIRCNSFRTMSSIIGQINFLKNSHSRPNTLFISEILGISRSHLFRVSEDPTYFPNQKEISRTIPPRQNLLTISKENIKVSSI